ncbi:hypothetical protein C6499_21115 [Candidatus Poribacteria bacterium]|nr:MAG: hypothetical protein C6499_21115 [Candidatus Poribacteria bacterium]
MKIIFFLLFSITFCAIALPALSELTVQDFDKIRSIIKEEIEDEVDPIKSEVSSIKSEVSSIKSEISSIKSEISSINQNVASLDGRVGGIEKQITWLMAIIIVAVGIPQIVIAWRSRKDREQDRRIEELAREIESLKQQQIVNP